LGVTITDADKYVTRGFILSPTHADKAAAVIREDKPIGSIQAVHYTGAGDYPAVRSFAKSFGVHKGAKTLAPTLRRASLDELYARLRNVRQYANADFAVAVVPFDKLLALCRYVRSHKYHQVHTLADWYRDAKLALFEPAEVRFASGKRIFQCPPIVEESGTQFVLIDGNVQSGAAMRTSRK
jgi:hypothetical protein